MAKKELLHLLSVPIPQVQLLHLILLNGQILRNQSKNKYLVSQEIFMDKDIALIKNLLMKNIEN
jgi:hypothetical protein